MSDYTPSTDAVTAAWVAASATHKPEHITRLIESVRAEERERIARNIARELGEGRAADLAREGA